MLLSYDMIIDETYSISYTGIAPVDEDTRFSGVQIDRFREPDSNLIYITIGEPGPDAACGLYVKDETDALYLLIEVQQVFIRYNNWYNEVLSTALDGHHPQEVLNLAVKMLDNPVAIIDTSSRTLMYAGEFHGSIEGSIWKSVLENGFSRYEAYPAKFRKEIREKHEQGQLLTFQSPFPNNENHISAPLLYDGILFAGLGMTDINKPFTRSEVQLAKIIADILSLSFAIGGKIPHFSSERTYYIDAILQGKTVDPVLHDQYLRQLHWKQEDRYQLLCIRFPDEREFNRDEREPVLFRLGLLFPDSLGTYINHTVVLVIRNPTRKLIPSYSTNLTSYLAGQGMIAGCSTIVNSLTDIRYAYTQGVLALQGKDESGIYYFLDDYKNVIIESLYSLGDIRSFCHPGILNLYTQDKANGIRMIQTIYAFMNCGESISTAAKELNIHRNTLIYRLERLEATYGIHLKNLDSELRFYLIITCQIIFYLDRKEHVAKGLSGNNDLCP